MDASGSRFRFPPPPFFTNSYMRLLRKCPTDVPASECSSPPSWRSDRCFHERLSGLCSVPLRHLAQKISHCPAVRQRCRRTVANRSGHDTRGRFARSGSGGDRKSTRLNSSHGYISYAVFCLKKKKKQKHNSYIKNKKKNKKH